MAGLVLFVAIVAGAAAGVLDTALGAATASTGRPAGDSAATGPANGALRAGTVPGYLIPLFTAAAASSTCRLPAALLAAQSQVESGYQVDAISSAGAVGIMQFLPATWATAGIDGDHDGQANIFDPADAIYSAARLDCNNLAAIQTAGISGDPTGLMLAAYNAGLGTVLSCRCVLAIPQTENYVASIEARAPELAAVASPTRTATGGELSYPLAVRAVVTQTYGPHTDGAFHPGIDLAAPDGTPILAATAGTITYAGWETGYGNYICLAAAATFATCYAHLATITVAVGQTLLAGQPLGTEGASGDATGPHLHFEVRINGQTVDPSPYLPPA